MTFTRPLTIQGKISWRRWVYKGKNGSIIYFLNPPFLHIPWPNPNPQPKPHLSNIITIFTSPKFKLMNIALIGYGKMGHEIESILISRRHNLKLIIDIHNRHEFTVQNLQKCDVAIEFTTPASVLGNIDMCFQAGIPVVAGTTGWHDHLPEVSQKCIETGNTLFHASNYSIGVNLMFAVNEYLAKLMNRFPEYDVSMTETHHTRKLDAPSGTAVSLAQQIINNLERKTGWVLGETENGHEIPVRAIREGDVTGTHEVTWDSEVDYLQLKHFARSRKGFATGAVLAAEFLPGKKGVFTMRDLLGV